MSDWQPDLYLKFAKERTQPSIDLAVRIDLSDPKRIIDIGCGPGNSTNVLKARWPQAQIVGLDNSEAMIDEARSKYPDMYWIHSDASGDLTKLGSFDIVFSNAAVQWMPNQQMLLPKLFAMLNKNGVLAVQVPCTKYMPIYTELEKLIAAEKWKDLLADIVSSDSTHAADFYYDILCGLAPQIDLWETNYFQVVNSHSDMVEWYSASGLRPYLDRLGGSPAQSEFLKEYENAVKNAYCTQIDGKLLFPYTRVFFIAKKI